MAIRLLKLVIHYDGTAYHGWQRQPGMPTIQGTIEAAFEKLTGRTIEVIGSSRTDAGVHALGQVAHADLTDCPIPTENFQNALNNLLPGDIVIADVKDAPENFDAISDTVKKTYYYIIQTAPIRCVLTRNQWHRPGQLDVDKMAAAAKMLEGTHDFKSFASAADQRESSVRTINHCIVKQACGTIVISVTANGFLYNMVRNIVGTLIEVGRGRWQPEDIDAILAAKDRSAAGPIAPASGLCLMRIDY
ncbi:MAG: tRNA pseudouridine(38-40) synthase TruA [Planctomycetaceae bacterium]|nr:tRNA pseudouridine(38-40) synthase TruA [Planctomycetaceae bacterium]